MIKIVWVYYHGDHNIGGGGAAIKIYSSSDMAMKNNPGDWELTAPDFYELKNASIYEPISLYAVQVDIEG